jgi:hypothetical protein
MAVTHDAVAAIRQLQVLTLGDEGVGLRDQCLRQHSASAFTRDFGQWIVDRFRLTERDDGAISRHGVSLLSGGSGRLDTRLDTPPSIKRRHPDSRIALRPVDIAKALKIGRASVYRVLGSESRPLMAGAHAAERSVTNVHYYPGPTNEGASAR